MKISSREYNLEHQQPCNSILACTFLFIIIFNVGYIFAQDTTAADFASSVPVTADTTRNLFGGKITNSGYGGVILKFSSVNDQFAFMTGGRGAITINNRYTIGGGGYGTANSIDILDSSADTNRLFKMGYGGIELGYIFLPGKRINIGGYLLIAAGAAFWQNKPKSNGERLFDDDFNIFPVLEPSLYIEIFLNRFMRLHTGISYRYVHHAHLEYMTDQNLRGLSCYIGLLFKIQK
jgi:hypothetical protein